MKPTGERYFPDQKEVKMGLEHWHRYLAVREFCRGMVLDVACGTGYGSALLADSDIQHVTGVDQSESAVRYAKERFSAGKKISFSCADASKLPFRDNTFDSVVSMEMIEHLPEEEQRRFLSEVRRVLKPEGIFFVSTPNRPEYDKLLAGGKNPFHLKEYDQNEFNDLLRMYFQSVSFLEQKVLCMSSIGEKILAPVEISYALEMNTDGFEFVGLLNKANCQPEYFIAVCGNSGVEKLTCSYCVDLNGTVFSQMKDQEVRLKGAARTIDNLREELDNAGKNINLLAAQIDSARESHANRDREEKILREKLADCSRRLEQAREEVQIADEKRIAQERLVKRTIEKKLEELASRAENRERILAERVKKNEDELKAVRADRDRLSILVANMRGQLTELYRELSGKDDRFMKQKVEMGMLMVKIQEKNRTIEEKAEELRVKDREIEEKDKEIQKLITEQACFNQKRLIRFLRFLKILDK